MSLSELPNEILYKILGYLQPLPWSNEKQKQALCNLSICSHRLHAVVEPILYYSYEDSHESSFKEFVKTILNVPRLAQCVKSFQGTDKPRYRRRRVTHSARGLQKVELNNLPEEKIKQLCPQGENPENWLLEIRYGSWDAITALTLICLPLLQSLRLAVHGADGKLGLELNEYAVETGRYGEFSFHPSYYYWLDRTFRTAAALQQQSQLNTLGSMSNLETVELKSAAWPMGGCLGRGMATSQVIPFASLPSVQTLVFDGFRFAYWDAGKPYLKVKTLELRNFEAGSSMLKLLLGSFASVQCIYLELGDYVVLNVPVLAEAMKHLKHCLQELTLRSYTPVPLSERGSIFKNSLVRFERLEILDASMHYLLDWGHWTHFYLDADHGLLVTPLSDNLPKSLKE